MKGEGGRRVAEELSGSQVRRTATAWLGTGVVAAAGVLAVSLSLAAASEAPRGGTPLPDNPLQGRFLFESKHCNQCHGIPGSGPDIGPNLGEGHFSGTFLDLGAALWNHVPGMSVGFGKVGLPWPELTATETTQLIAFFYSIDYLGRPGVAASGREVFETRGCASCHTIGRGRGSAGPDLAELTRFASPLYVAEQIWNHGPSMFESMRALKMAPPSFADGNLADLSAFIRQQAEAGLQAPQLLAPGNPNRGRALFASKGCSSCHGTSARGGAGAPDLTHSDLHRSADAIAGTMWNHALAMNDIMRERGIGWPQFEGSELADLVAFLYFLPFADPPGNARRGSEVFATRGCADCHAVDAEDAPTAKVGPALVGERASQSAPALVAAMWNHAPIMRRAILGEGRPWPDLTGEDLRHLGAFLEQQAARR